MRRQLMTEKMKEALRPVNDSIRYALTVAAESEDASVISTLSGMLNMLSLMEMSKPQEKYNFEKFYK